MVRDVGGATAFLDAPGLDDDQLERCLAEVVASLPTGFVLTIFSDADGADDTISSSAAAMSLDHVATIPHDDGGSTFTLRSPG